MKYLKMILGIAMAMILGGAAIAFSQRAGESVSREAGTPPADAFPPPGSPDFGGPPPFGPGGGPGGMEETKLVKQFDKNGDKRLNTEERKAAREFIKQQRANRRAGGPGGNRPGFGPPGERQEPAKAGPRVAVKEVTSHDNAPLYATNILRTLFLEFESADWEQELEDFFNTDVEVPAKLVADGKTYADVGIHFRGASSYMMVAAGRKRSLNLSLDYVHEKQNLGGYRTLNLLNSHEDPTFLRTVLYFDIARQYIPAPKANWVRLVINGESWGVYVSVQQFNKDFVNEWFGTTKGARWKVPGSPNGHGSLAYLGDDPAAYKRIYDLKSKDDPQAWASLIQLCKALDQTPPDRLEAALAPLLDVDGALKFLALENALINNDGYWVRTSDYSLYQDEKGRFHIIPHDANETFSMPGGPGGFGPGMLFAPEILSQADKNQDNQLARAEFTALADAWFGKLDAAGAGKVSQEQFFAKFQEILPPPAGFPGAPPPAGGNSPGEARPGGARDGFGPARFMGAGMFAALDANHDNSLTRAEIKSVFEKWYGDWDTKKRGVLDEEAIRSGLSAALPRPEFGRPGGGPAGQGNRRGPGGPGMGGGNTVKGVELDPLLAAQDANKPLISKLLAVPALRTRYLGYVREIAERWLDWKRLGPIAEQYQALLAEQVKADTRKLSSYEAFEQGVSGRAATENRRGPGRQITLKSFADQRRAYLLDYSDAKK